MIITINKDTKAEDIQEAIKKLPKRENKDSKDFYGKLKGAFGDGLEYQKRLMD